MLDAAHVGHTTFSWRSLTWCGGQSASSTSRRHERSSIGSSTLWCVGAELARPWRRRNHASTNQQNCEYHLFGVIWCDVLVVVTGEGVPEPVPRASEADAVQSDQGNSIPAFLFLWFATFYNHK